MSHLPTCSPLKKKREKIMLQGPGNRQVSLHVIMSPIPTCSSASKDKRTKQKTFSSPPFEEKSTDSLPSHFSRSQSRISQIDLNLESRSCERTCSWDAFLLYLSIIVLFFSLYVVHRVETVRTCVLIKRGRGGRGRKQYGERGGELNQVSVAAKIFSPILG